MVVAMICFITNDALIKYTSQSMPTMQLIFVRGLMATALVLVVAHALGATGQLRQALARPVLARAGVDAVATMLYLASLFSLPIANATSINLATPLFITVLAALLLAEQVGWRRWSAILVGFTGVLMVIQPSADGFNVYSLVCLLATLGHAIRDLLTRRIAPGTPSILITLATAASVTLLAGVLSVIDGWQAFGWLQLGTLALASIFLAGGYYWIIDAIGTPHRLPVIR